ncbi:MAG: hypothetical protein HQL86_09385, partial [Magnetococcales bacterium]|nr:hypothetical protein [Magnetococcales bacterium]
EQAHICLMTRPGFDASDEADCPAMAFLNAYQVSNPEALDRTRLGGYGLYRMAVTPVDLSSTALRVRLSRDEIPNEATSMAVIDYARAHELYRA